MRIMNLLTAVMVASLVGAPAFAAEDGGNSGSTIHCSPAKNADAAADPNCAQRVPPMPNQVNADAPPSAPVNSGSQR
jgi:hypothetical protein